MLLRYVLPMPLIMCLSATLFAEHANDPAVPVILGAGAHHYRWVHQWAKLPADVTFGGTHGCIVIDSQDRVYVNTEGEYAVLVFAPDGTLIGKWGQAFRASAHGMCLVRDANGSEVIWLAHFGLHNVTKFTLDGKPLQTIEWPQSAGMYTTAEEFKPTAVAVAPGGDIYVADGYGKSWVHQFHGDGTYVRSWDGSSGAGGRFDTPHGIGIDTWADPPQVVVADRTHNKLQRFSLSGDFIGVVDGLRLPCKVVFHGDDLVVPELQGRVTIYDRNYHVVTYIGDNPDHNQWAAYEVKPELWHDGIFLSPHGAAWDSQGNLYVEDWNRVGRVTKLERVR